jgi:hypothetical protein
MLSAFKAFETAISAPTSSFDCWQLVFRLSLFRR